MGTTLLRQWTMLRAIPRAPHKKSAPQLLDALDAQGFKTTLRTVQRDLEQLSAAFPLYCDDRATPYGWQWARDATVFDVPAMEPQTALAFWMAQEHLRPLMPPVTLKALDGYFRQARHVLNDTGNTVSAWPEKVRVLSRGQPLIPPEVNDAVLSTVYEALRLERRFHARYRRRQDQKLQDYDVNPLGVVLRGSVIYLICTAFDYDDVLQFALHRMEAAELSDTPAHTPEGFDLDAYVQERYLDFRLGDPLRLHLRMDSEIAKHLEETPLSEDQWLGEEQDGWREITATVSDTSQLRWWLLGFGGGVEVVAPMALREEIASVLSEAVSIYQEPTVRPQEAGRR